MPTHDSGGGNGNAWARWAIGTLLMLTLSGFTAFAYLNTAHVSRSEFDTLQQRIIRIEDKVDRLLDRPR